MPIIGTLISQIYEFIWFYNNFLNKIFMVFFFVCFLPIFALIKTDENDSLFGNGDTGLFGGTQLGLLHAGDARD